MIWVPLLNAHITTGDFLLAEQEDSDQLSVCCVICVLFPDQLRVTWWLTDVENLPSLEESFINLRKCRIREVTERILAIGMITIFQVKDIAFVFHALTLEHDIVNCAGMNRVFFTRYRFDVNDNLVELNARNHYPFSTAVTESFPSRIWWSIVLVKEKTMKLLCDTKQYQSTKKSVSFPFSLESWAYFNRCMQICNPISLQYFRNKCTSMYIVT